MRKVHTLLAIPRPAIARTMAHRACLQARSPWPGEHAAYWPPGL